MTKGGTIAGSAMAVWVGGFVLHCAFIRYGVSIYDEGLMLSDAAAMLAGHWPVSDFWSTYPPGAYAWIAIVFRVFGSQMLFARLAGIAIVAALPAICLPLLAPTLGLGRALLFSAAMALWSAGTMTYFDYPPPIAAVGCVTAILILQGQYGMRRITGAGLVCGFTALIRLDLGFAAMLACAAMILIRADGSRDGSDGLLQRLRQVIVLGLLSAIPVVSALILYFYHGGMQAWGMLYRRLIKYNAVDFPSARRIPLPSLLPLAAHELALDLEIVLIYFMIALLVILALQILLRLRGGFTTDGTAAALVVLALFGAILFHSRADAAHAWVLLALGTIAGFRAFGGNFLVLPLLALLLAGGLAATQERWNADYLTPQVALNEPHAAGILIPDWYAGYRQVIDTARSANMIYSGGDQHRHVFVNDVLVYYLSDHLPPTAFLETVPAIVDTAPVQQQMAEDLRRAKPSLVIGIPQPMLEPNLSSRDGHVTILDDEINQHCRQFAVIADHVLRRCEWTSSDAERGN